MKKRANNFRIHLKDYFQSIGYNNTNLIEKDDEGIYTYNVYTSYFNGSKINWGYSKSNTKVYKNYLKGFMEIFIAQLIAYDSKTIVDGDRLHILFISNHENIVVTLHVEDYSWDYCEECDY